MFGYGRDIFLLTHLYVVVALEAYAGRYKLADYDVLLETYQRIYLALYSGFRAPPGRSLDACAKKKENSRKYKLINLLGRRRLKEK